MPGMTQEGTTAILNKVGRVGFIKKVACKA